jgi:hypothetical protein
VNEPWGKAVILGDALIDTEAELLFDLRGVGELKNEKRAVRVTAKGVKVTPPTRGVPVE